jgi:hypothetical protein
VTGPEFEQLGAGDVVKNESTNELYLIDQVRLSAFYVAVRCDEKFEPLGLQKFALRSADNLVLHKKATDR